jgi:hypothetical protein
MQIIGNGDDGPSNAAQAGGLGNALNGVASVFMDTGQQQMRAAALAQAARTAAAQGGLGQLFATGSVDPRIAGAAIANGATPDQVGQAIRLAHNLSGGADDATAANAATGIGAYGTTPLSQARAEAAARVLSAQGAAQTLAAEAAARSGAYENFVLPDGTLSRVPVGSAPAGAQPLVGTDQGKQQIITHFVAPQPGGAVNPPDDTEDDTPAPLSSAFVGPPQEGQTVSATGPAALAKSGAAPSAVTAQPTPDAPAREPMTDDQSQVAGLSPAVEQRKWGVVGEDIYGNKQYGYPPTQDNYDAAHPAPAAAAPGAAPAAVPPALQTLHGADFISALQPAVGAQVQAIVDGRAPYPTGMLLKTPFGQQLAAFVTQADPSFDATNYNARKVMRDDFSKTTPNSAGGTIVAGQAAIGHLGHLSDIVGQLGNVDSGIPGNNLYNAAVNGVGLAAGGAIPVGNFNTIKGKLVEELTKFYRGTGGTEADVNRDLAGLSPNMSAPQLNAAVNTISDLVQSKVSALQNRWNTTMGPTAGDYPLLTAQNQQALKVIRQRAAPAGASPDGQSTAATPSATPSAAPSAAPAAPAPGVTHVWTPNGGLQPVGQP